MRLQGDHDHRSRRNTSPTGPMDPKEINRKLQLGTVAAAQALIDAGVDLKKLRLKGGYDALSTAMFGRPLSHDAELIPLIRFLVAQGVPLSGESEYGESALSQLSWAGRFDAAAELLAAGADERLLGWGPLARTVALGTPAELQASLVASAEQLESRDRWHRTPYIVAVTAGRIEFAAALLAAGADPDATDHVGRPAIFHAAAAHRFDAVQWLLQQGADVNATSGHGDTPLKEAVDNDDLAMVDFLLCAGARPVCNGESSLLDRARSRAVACRLLSAGVDTDDLSGNVQRLFTGQGQLPADQAFAGVSKADFERDRTRRFGTAHPERMASPFWLAMLRSGLSGFEASRRFQAEPCDESRPVWCAERFGQSITWLPDGRIVQIAGEHEDGYDPDFCIYNDVFVHTPAGDVSILGYPQEVFPPTDFHSATLVGDAIIVIGSLGYFGERAYGTTPVFALDTRTWRFKRLVASGTLPGWIHRHRARQVDERTIVVTGGSVLTMLDGQEQTLANHQAYSLDLRDLTWRLHDIGHDESGR